ncbi:peptidase inhibitor family I36 protein [Kitasatospora sp. NPDC058397]|uniref:peptidase inhibitor family I36 protein n=1 Tax=unclassified Kitasatospora TaxID=2633591 RepID=UPI003654A2A0
MTNRFARAARRAGLAGVALVTVAGTALLATPPANAAEQCWGEDVCMWDQPDGQGQIHRVSVPADGTCIPLDVTWADGTTSQAKTVHNAGSGGLAGFESTDCSGKPLTLLGPNNYANVSRAHSVRVVDCESGKVCFWENDNFSGSKSTADYADSCSPIGIDSAKTVWNRTSKAIGLYEGWACVGAGWKGDVPSGGWSSLNSGSVSKISRV